MTTIKEDNFETLKLSHTKEEIARRLRGGVKHSYLRDFIYGAVDGLVTTFAVVSGVAGAALAPSIVLILGTANLVADGFSMAVSNFLATRSDQELRTMARRMEELHIEKVPMGEREEVRQIFAAKGFSGKELERIVKVITSDRKRWVDTMLKEELGLTIEGSSPGRAACTTFSAFTLIGSLPLMAFFFNFVFPKFSFNPFIVSTCLTGAAFFTVGAFKSRFVGQNWWRAGMETFFIGSAAASFAYFVGAWIKNAISI